MAKVAQTGTMLSRVITIVGRHETLDDGRVRLHMDVDGRSTSKDFSVGTHQEATYIAAVQGVRRADRDLVTHLEIVSPNNILRGHMTEGWKRGAVQLHSFQGDLDNFNDRFDVLAFN